MNKVVKKGRGVFRIGEMEKFLCLIEIILGYLKYILTKCFGSMIMGKTTVKTLFDFYSKYRLGGYRFIWI